MAKQKDYLNALLTDDNEGDTDAPSPTPARIERARGTTLLGRESALARAASGEVRQVTQLLLDPARCRIWPGNARVYADLNEESCRELIDSILAEGGQKVPAVVRKVADDPDHDYEVIAGTRRHWSISWLRAHNYPDITFLAQVQQLDDESAFRLADLENRARADVSDIERARNYAAALEAHYGGHQTRMAERLRVSKGWLSKMLKVATLPDWAVTAFASPSDILLKPGYAFVQTIDGAAPDATKRMRAEAARIAAEQATTVVPAATVIARIDAAGKNARGAAKPEMFHAKSRHGRDMVTMLSANRQGVTLRFHAGSGASDDEMIEAAKNALDHLARTTGGLRH